MPHKREEIARAIREVDATAAGAKLLSYLLDFCHIFRNSMPKDCNPNLTLFNEGQRSVGNEIIALLVNEPARFKAETLREIAARAQGETE
ncbi:MAG: hypothetical protein H6883_08070 [Rhodobiaceae bacterium]|nr:hypothetical protein [Rhodobiaceae bacterium]MCC0056078.1 hypothetical protein [Rhodobiaceae bacterium]